MLGDRLSYTNQESWEIFIQTLLEDKNLKVELFDERFRVMFNSLEQKNKLLLLLGSPEEIRSKVIHAVFGDNEVSHDARSQDEQSKLRASIAHFETIDVKAFVRKVFADKFLQGLQLSFDGFVKNASNSYEATYSFENKVRAKRAHASFELMQSALSNPDIYNLLTSGKKIDSEMEEAEITQFADQLLNVGSLQEKQFNVRFDFGFLWAFLNMPELLRKSYMSALSEKVSEVDSFVSIDELTAEFDKKDFIQYFNQVVESGVIFARSNEGNSQTPIVAVSSRLHDIQENFDKPLRVKLVVDFSTSLASGFDDYKQRIISTIFQIRNKYPNSSIQVQTFSNKAQEHLLDAQSNFFVYDFKQIKSLGATNLNGAIDLAVSNVGNDNDVIILFTDGYHNSGLTTFDQVCANIRQKRNENSQFCLFAFGAGDFDRNFFKTISKEAGFIVSDAREGFSDLSRLLNHLDDLTKTKIMFEFVKLGETLRIQAAPDNPRIANFETDRYSVSVRSTLAQGEGRVI